MYKILTPSMFDNLTKRIENNKLTLHRLKQQMLFKSLLNTGMRLTELKKFSENTKWFDSKNRCINLPEGSTKTGEERCVQLTPQFSDELSRYFINNRLEVPTRIAINKNLKEWGFSDITTKTFRKTWETWLVFAEYDITKITLSQGHSEIISLKNYIKMSSVLKSERDAVLEKTKGWGL